VKIVIKLKTLISAYEVSSYYQEIQLTCKVQREDSGQSWDA